MMGRLKLWVVRFILSIDKLLCVWLRGWAYVWLNKGELPETDESISGFVGKSALSGAKWALIAQTVINFVMRNPDHCRVAAGNDSHD